MAINHLLCARVRVHDCAQDEIDKWDGPAYNTRIWWGTYSAKTVIAC